MRSSVGLSVSGRAAVSATQPVAREINPRFAYERLFGSKDKEGREMTQEKRGDFQSMLDLAYEDAKRLRQLQGQKVMFDDASFRLGQAMNPQLCNFHLGSGGGGGGGGGGGAAAGGMGGAATLSWRCMDS